MKILENAKGPSLRSKFLLESDQDPFLIFTGGILP
jgi:hypothetical protein